MLADSRVPDDVSVVISRLQGPGHAPGAARRRHAGPGQAPAVALHQPPVLRVRDGTRPQRPRSLPVAEDGARARWTSWWPNPSRTTASTAGRWTASRASCTSA